MPDPQNGLPAVSVRLNAAGGKKMLDFTSQNVGKRMGVVYIERIPQTKIVDGKEVRTSKKPKKSSTRRRSRACFGTRFQTTGLESMKKRDRTCAAAACRFAGRAGRHRRGARDRPEPGPGQHQQGRQGGHLGLLAVLIFAAIYYHLFGLIADLGLILNLVLLVAVLSMFQATLTMPGIAGIVLTLGMAIDANVLICERIREEMRNGSTPLAVDPRRLRKSLGDDSRRQRHPSARGLRPVRVRLRSDQGIRGDAADRHPDLDVHLGDRHARDRQSDPQRAQAQRPAVGGGYARGARKSEH